MKVVRQFYRYLFRHPYYFSGFLVCFIVSKVAENLQPFYFKWITGAITSSNYDLGLTYIIGLGASMVIGTVFHAIFWLCGDRGIVKSAIELQLDVMRQIHSLDFAYHTEKSSGKLISMMKRGEDAFFNFFDILNIDILSLVISIVLMLFAFSSLGVKYIALSIGLIIFALACSVPLLKTNLKRRTLFNDTEDAASAARVDNLVNFDTVKYFAKERFEQDRLRGLLHHWYSAAQSYFNTYRYMDVIIGNIANFAVIGTVLFAVNDLRLANIGLPDFVLVTSFSASFFPRLMNLVMTLRNAARRFTDLKSYFDVLSQQTTVADPANPKQISHLIGRIDFQKISFSYHKKNPVFQNFSLQIQPGESVALVGLSGSGKTTLVKLLMRMYDVNKGEICIDGVNIRDLAKSDLRGFVGIVPQDPLMFNHSLRYNVAYARPDATDKDVWSALALAKLDAFVTSLPEGLNTAVGERGIKLSGGQRQRLAIARVLLEKAKIIVLDEATSSLDSESEGIVQEAFWGLVKDPTEPRTSIIIAHRLSTIMKTDRIIVLNNGQISEMGTHAQLIKHKNGIYHHLWSLQQNGFISE